MINIDKEIKKSLNKFVKDRKIDDQFLVSILKDMILKYPNETLRQHAIRSVIMFFEDKYKDEYDKAYDKQIKKRREKAVNKYSADKENDFRLSFSIPETLLARIEAILEELKLRNMLPEDESNFMSNDAVKKFKEDEWFVNNFPRYVVPQEY